MFPRLLVVCCLTSAICGMTIPPTPKDAKDISPKEKKEAFQKEFIGLLMKYDDILPEIQRDFLTEEGGYIFDYDSDSDSYSEEEERANVRRRRCGSCGCSPLPSGLSEDAAYDWLNFQKNGVSEIILSIFNFFKALKIKEFAEDSLADAERLYPGSVHNGEGDAFRHALWMYRVTKKYGSSVAKNFGDAHERSSVNPLNERLMDLYNNEVGRCLGSNSDNHGRDDIDVIRGALESGKLQTSLGSYPGSPGSGYAYGKK